MRCDRHALWLLAFWAGLGAAASAQSTRKPEDLLRLRPKMAGVECDTPTDPAAIAACKVENVLNAQQQPIGYALRDGSGKLLRRFVAARQGKYLDRWSYYQDGFEVYREEDLDGDRHLDECRWLNSGGTRVAEIAGGKIKAWKRISPEEASKVLVQAIVADDPDLLATVMATPSDLKLAGLPESAVEPPPGDWASALKELRKGLLGWDAQTIWNRFDGAYPRVIPADPAIKLEHDLTLYENAMIFPASTNPRQPQARMAFLQVADLIQVGSTWKFLALPHALDPDKPVLAAADGLRSKLFVKNEAGPVVRDEAMEQALKALADYDAQHADAAASGQNEKIARYYYDRIPLLRAVVASARNPEDQLNYNKQIVDSVVAAIRTGLYADGRQVLNKLIDEGGKLGSYAAYRLIEVDFAARSDDPASNMLANQKKWMADLEGFLTRFADADEAPDALLQLASASEYNAEEDKARAYYERLIKNYAASEASKKAAGALRRLGLVGKTLAIKGAGLNGETIDSAAIPAKAQVFVFWTTWASNVRADLPELIRVYQKFRDRGLEMIGVNLDNEKATLEQYLKEHPIPWPQIYEPRGMDSRLAVEYGIFSLPTLFLVDAAGKVVTCTPRTALELERQLEKLLPAAAAAGAAADRR